MHHSDKHIEECNHNLKKSQQSSFFSTTQLLSFYSHSKYFLGFSGLLDLYSIYSLKVKSNYLNCWKLYLLIGAQEHIGISFFSISYFLPFNLTIRKRSSYHMLCTLTFWNIQRDNYRTVSKQIKTSWLDWHKSLLPEIKPSHRRVKSIKLISFSSRRCLLQIKLKHLLALNTNFQFIYHPLLYL